MYTLIIFSFLFAINIPSKINQRQIRELCIFLHVKFVILFICNLTMLKIEVFVCTVLVFNYVNLAKLEVFFKNYLSCFVQVRHEYKNSLHEIWMVETKEFCVLYSEVKSREDLAAAHIVCCLVFWTSSPVYSSSNYHWSCVSTLKHPFPSPSCPVYTETLQWQFNHGSFTQCGFAIFFYNISTHFRNEFPIYS
jgi:hypothetical protein